MPRRHATLVVAAALALATAACAAGAPNPGVPASGPAALVSPAPSLAPAYEAERITVEAFVKRRAAGEDLLLVDVRWRNLFDEGHARGAISAPWSDLRTGAITLPKDRPLVLYCT